MVLPALITVQNAYAHVLQFCNIGQSDLPAGNLLKGTNVWVAYQGTAKIVKYPHTDCSNRTTYNIATPASPLFIANSGSSKISFTDNANNKIRIFDTSTGTVTSTITWQSSKPWDITMDPNNTDHAWFTFDNTNSIGRLTTSTATVTTYTFGTAGVSKAKGISVGDTDIFFTDIGTDKVWKRSKSTGAYTSLLISGDSYGVAWVNTPDALDNVYVPNYSTNKLWEISENFASYNIRNAHPQSMSTDGTTPTGMFRIANCNTDVCVTYFNSGHTGAIHIPPEIPGYHKADWVSGNPYNVIYDTTIGGTGVVGNHVTKRTNTISPPEVIRLTHFPD